MGEEYSPEIYFEDHEIAVAEADCVQNYISAIASESLFEFAYAAEGLEQVQTYFQEEYMLANQDIILSPNDIVEESSRISRDEAAVNLLSFYVYSRAQFRQTILVQIADLAVEENARSLANTLSAKPSQAHEMGIDSKRDIDMVVQRTRWAQQTLRAYNPGFMQRFILGDRANQLFLN